MSDTQFRPIRKKMNEISTDAVKALLTKERRGVLSINSDIGYPYAVPINFRYAESENKIYFHGALVGYKAELLKRDEHVCFTVYGHESVKELDWAPYVQSVIVFGRCRHIEDREQTIALVREFARKYYPNDQLIEEEIVADGKAVQMYEIEIDHMSGKEIQEI